eukprot:6197525-Pleurochrysis_carterae.AAC.3
MKPERACSRSTEQYEHATGNEREGASVELEDTHIGCAMAVLSYANVASQTNLAKQRSRGVPCRTWHAAIAVAWLQSCTCTRVHSLTRTPLHKKQILDKIDDAQRRHLDAEVIG